MKIPRFTVLIIVLTLTVLACLISPQTPPLWLGTETPIVTAESIPTAVPIITVTAVPTAKSELGQAGCGNFTALKTGDQFSVTAPSRKLTITYDGQFPGDLVLVRGLYEDDDDGQTFLKIGEPTILIDHALPFARLEFQRCDSGLYYRVIDLSQLSPAELASTTVLSPQLPDCLEEGTTFRLWTVNHYGGLTQEMILDYTWHMNPENPQGPQVEFLNVSQGIKFILAPNEVAKAPVYLVGIADLSGKSDPAEPTYLGEVVLFRFTGLDSQGRACLELVTDVLAPEATSTPQPAETWTWTITDPSRVVLNIYAAEVNRHSSLRFNPEEDVLEIRDELTGQKVSTTPALDEGDIFYTYPNKPDFHYWVNRTGGKIASVAVTYLGQGLNIWTCPTESNYQVMGTDGTSYTFGHTRVSLVSLDEFHRISLRLDLLDDNGQVVESQGLSVEPGTKVNFSLDRLDRNWIGLHLPLCDGRVYFTELVFQRGPEP